MNKLCYVLLALNALLTPLPASVQFDGSNDFINAGSDPSLDDLGPVTFSFWMRARSLGEDNLGRVLDKGGSFHGIQLTSPNRIVFVKDYATTDLRRESDDNSVVIGAWQHWAITYGGGTSATSIKMFIDGVEQTVYQGQSDAAGSYVSDAANDLIIGNRAAADRTFDGDLAELAIWDAVLSNTEIEHLAQHRPRTPLQVRRSSLVAYWTLSEFPYGQAVTAPVLDTSGGGHHGTPSNSPTGGGWFLSRGAPATPAPNPDPQPWELTSLLDAAAVEQHFTAPAAAGSGNGSSCANAESLATAVGHVDPGDHHLLCAGTYTGPTITRACTQAKPCVWRSVVNANGDPVDAYFDGTTSLDAKWHSFRGVRFGDTDGTNGNAAVRMREQGTSLINAFVYGHRNGSGVDSFPYGANMILYGVTMANNGLCGNSPPAHNIYTQNKGQLHGTKYYIQMISLDGDCPAAQADRWSFHAYNESPGTDSRTNRIHLQDSLFQDSSFVLGTNAIGYPDELNTIKNDWFFNLNEGTFFRVGYVNPFQGRVTGNLFYDAKIQWFFWGAGSVGYTPNDIIQFENNELINPTGGEFIDIFQTKTYTSTTTLNGSGNPKILDNTVWDNNTYRIASGGTFHLDCNTTDHGNLSFANWKIQTDNCRVTPDGSGSANGFDVNSTFTGTMRTVDQVECFDNYYQPGWGYCRAVDWDGNGSVTLPAAEVQKIIGSGKAWKVWSAYTGPFPTLGAALETGTCGTPCEDITVTDLPAEVQSGVLPVIITSAP